MTHKITVFPNKNEDKDLDPVRLTEFLENVKRRLTICKITGNESNFMFGDTIMLAMALQQLWNLRCTLCETILDLTTPGQSHEQALVSLNRLRALAERTLHTEEENHK